MKRTQRANDSVKSQRSGVKGPSVGAKLRLSLEARMMVSRVFGWIFLFQLACRQHAPNAAVTDIQGLKVALESQPHQTPLVIDVRTQAEYDAGHIPTARHIPLNELESRLEDLAAVRDKPIFLVCEVGARSNRATQLLLDKGFSRAVNVDGGTRAWREAGYPLD